MAEAESTGVRARLAGARRRAWDALGGLLSPLRSDGNMAPLSSGGDNRVPGAPHPSHDRMSASEAPVAKKKSTSKQTKAGLVLPVARIEKRLRSAKIAKQVGTSASIFLTGVVEHVLTSAMTSANSYADAKKTKRLADAHLISAVRSDPDTARLFAGFSFASSTEAPRAMDVILPAKEAKARRDKIANRAVAPRAPPTKKKSAPPPTTTNEALDD